MPQGRYNLVVQVIVGSVQQSYEAQHLRTTYTKATPHDVYIRPGMHRMAGDW